MKRSEVESEPEAKEAVDGEFLKLANMPHPDKKGKGVWDIDRPAEASSVRRAAREEGTTVHFGQIAELCFQKGSELPKGDPLQRYKGRHVFLGDSVKDQDFDFAIFQDLGSSPPTMEAATALDALSCCPGYLQKQSDAFSAYTQSFLGGGRGLGTPTWVSLPKHRWPEWWHGKFTNPVVPLVLALYGHPDSGGYWEAHCEAAVEKCGWTKVDGWQSVFWHSESKAMLVIYVDDFKLACKAEDVERLWAALRKEIVLDPPTDPDRFLGCYLESFEASQQSVEFVLQNHPDLHPRGQDLPTPPNPGDPDGRVQGFFKTMSQYLDSAVDKYCAVAGIMKTDLKKVATPFLDESKFSQGCCEGFSAEGWETGAGGSPAEDCGVVEPKATEEQEGG